MSEQENAGDNKPLNIGIVCPYSFAHPGGVQAHIADFAADLKRRGHNVQVLVPTDKPLDLPPYYSQVVGTHAISYNGSKAHLCFGYKAARAVKKWVKEHNFDVIHLHEPVIPSLSFLTMWQAKTTKVATFHSAMNKSRLLQIFKPAIRAYLRKLDGKIAVSAEAARLITPYAGVCQIIPNGVDTKVFAAAGQVAKWQGGKERPTVVFLGRLDEKRKGLSVFMQGASKLIERQPNVRFLIAGPGVATEAKELAEKIDAVARKNGFERAVEFLGRISDKEKCQLLSSADFYVAPQLGGESFGIVLVEAMSAKIEVIASDLAAFRAVLAGGKYGKQFATGNANELAQVLEEEIAYLDTAKRAAQLEAAQEYAKTYDWENITQKILDLYVKARQNKPKKHSAASRGKKAKRN